jgi:hypothetical protein
MVLSYELQVEENEGKGTLFNGKNFLFCRTSICGFNFKSEIPTSMMQVFNK